jgi:hypothetical protein
MAIKGLMQSTVEEMPDDDSQLLSNEGFSMFRDEGGVEVQLEDGEQPIDEQEDDPQFDEDLTYNLSDSEREGLGSFMRELVEIDLQSREQWEQRLIDGLEIVGLKDVPEDRTAFMGAAQVTHPAVAEAIVQFQARAMEELLPPAGPVKVGVLGSNATDEDDKRASRVEDYMNYQLTDEDDEYYSDTDSMLFYLPYAGSAFKKVAIDPIIGRTRSRYITADDFIVPYFAKSLTTAPRYTHRYTMPLNAFKRAVDNGWFTDYEFQHTNVTQMSGDRRQLQDTSDYRQESYHPDDTVLTLCETHIEMNFEWETIGTDRKFKKPYVITWEWETGVVVGIRRLWAEDDEKCRKQVWFIHYKYLPGFGFYGLGLLHMIGGLGKAASGALRAVLDGSTTASLQGGFKSKDAKIAGDMVFSPGTWIDVDMTAEEMQKSFYTPPFKEPSEALFKTLDLLINGIQRFASTTEAMVGEASNTGPVGTTVALIEQGSKIFSGIHKRMHKAARTEFKLIAYCNWRYMHEEEYPYGVGKAQRSVFRADFAPDIDINPVSDPNIYSSVQRIALAQAVMQAVKDNPSDFQPAARRKALLNMFKAMKVPQAEEYLPDTMDQHLDPVSENEMMSITGLAKAFPEQDHQAHMAVHSAYMQEIIATGDQETIQKIVPILKAHITAHFALMYRQRVEQELMAKGGMPLPAFDPNKPEEAEQLSMEIENMVARAVAASISPPAQPQPQQDPKEAQKQAAFQAEQQRKQIAFQADQQRKSQAQKLMLQRKGLIPSEPKGAFSQAA